jgi:hypothetical protein
VKEDLIARLKSFGYDVTEDDDWLLLFDGQKVENYIFDYCNISELPRALYPMAVDMMAGEFLGYKKAMGQLAGFDFTAPVKQIQEGDTTVVFASGDAPERQFEGLIKTLARGDAGQLSRHRRLVW